MWRHLIHHTVIGLSLLPRMPGFYHEPISTSDLAWALRPGTVSPVPSCSLPLYPPFPAFSPCSSHPPANPPCLRLSICLCPALTTAARLRRTGRRAGGRRAPPGNRPLGAPSLFHWSAAVCGLSLLSAGSNQGPDIGHQRRPPAVGGRPSTPNCTPNWRPRSRDAGRRADGRL